MDENPIDKSPTPNPVASGTPPQEATPSDQGDINERREGGNAVNGAEKGGVCAPSMRTAQSRTALKAVHPEQSKTSNSRGGMLNNVKHAYARRSIDDSKTAHNEYRNTIYRGTLDSVVPYSSMEEGKARSGLLPHEIVVPEHDFSKTDRREDGTTSVLMGLGGAGCQNECHQQTSSEYVKALVFGGLDGIVTIFAIVSGCVGADLSPLKIIIIGVGNLFADAVSMGFGEYVSAKAEQDFIHSEKDRESWEVENCPEEERNEMFDIYTRRYAFTPEDARSMVDITFKYRKFFIQHMMVEELGLMVGEGGPTPIRRGLVMFLSFCIFGLVPLGGFMGWEVTVGAGSKPAQSTETAFIIACLVSLVTLFVLGFFKGRFVGQNAMTSGFLMTLNGTFAGLVAFSVGGFLQSYSGGILHS